MQKNMATDWRGDKSVTGCLEALCLKERMADVTFSFPGSDVRVHAHKLVLSLRSEVFEKMFYGPMAEQRQDIKIEDSDPESFKLFLRYVYSDATDFNGPTVLKCLYLGRKYCVESLVRACSLYLETSISPDNVCTIFEQADYFTMPELQEKCMLYMADHAEDVFKSDEFLALSCKSLAMFLERDDIYAKETCIFEAAVHWAKRQCAKSGEEESPGNLRRCLGDAFQCIRLPTISMATFAGVIGPSGLLSADEEINIYRHIACDSNKANAVQGTVAGFRSDKRKPRFATVVLSSDPTQVNSTFGYHAGKMTKYALVTVTSSLQMKLLSISGNIFDKGIQSVFLNNTALVPQADWCVKDQRFYIIGGTLLKKDVNNALTFTLTNNYVSNGEQKQCFDTLGANGTISYPACQDCSFDGVVLSAK